MFCFSLTFTEILIGLVVFLECLDLFWTEGDCQNVISNLGLRPSKKEERETYSFLCLCLVYQSPPGQM